MGRSHGPWPVIRIGRRQIVRRILRLRMTDSAPLFNSKVGCKRAGLRVQSSNENDRRDPAPRPGPGRRRPGRRAGPRGRAVDLRPGEDRRRLRPQLHRHAGSASGEARGRPVGQGPRLRQGLEVLLQPQDRGEQDRRSRGDPEDARGSQEGVQGRRGLSLQQLRVHGHHGDGRALGRRVDVHRAGHEGEVRPEAERRAEEARRGGEVAGHAVGPGRRERRQAENRRGRCE